jgi:hypothetical protein
MCNSILELVFRSTVFYHDGNAAGKNAVGKREFWLARQGIGEKPEKDGLKKASREQMILAYCSFRLGLNQPSGVGRKNV